MCQLLSDQIKHDRKLQQCLHVVRYNRAAEREEGEKLGPYAQREQVVGVPEMVKEFLSGVSECPTFQNVIKRGGKIDTELPPGIGNAAVIFQDALVKLAETNLNHARKLGRGMSTLRETQYAAKKLGCAPAVITSLHAPI